MARSDIISEKKGTFIIAEVGQNHNGNLMNALHLIIMAKKGGADAVKFTKMDVVNNYTGKVLNREYNSPNSFGKTYGEHRLKLEFEPFEMKALKVFAEAVGITIFWSVCDIQSFNEMDALDNPIIKIPSREITNIKLLNQINRDAGDRAVILSTGIAIQKTINNALKCLYNCNVYLMHCVSEYPTPPEHINLNRMNGLLKFAKGVIKGVGLSSHTPIISDAIVAVSHGAKIIEKHITINERFKGTDQKCSLDVKGFKAMSSLIREVEVIMGSEKIPTRYDTYVRRDMLKRKQPNGEYLIE